MKLPADTTQATTMSRYQLSKPRRISWILAVILIPVVTVFGIFYWTDDNIVPYENSQLAQHFTQSTVGLADPITPGAEDGAGRAEVEDVQFPAQYGQEGQAKTLILYDEQAKNADTGELYAVATANLATHFGQVEIQAIDDYQAHEMNKFDAAIFVGADWQSTLPQIFLDDVRDELVPVMWLGENIDQLTGDTATTDKSFIEQYGWDPDSPVGVQTLDITSLEYKDQRLSRASHSDGTLYLPKIEDEGIVTTVASGHCGKDPNDSSDCTVEDGSAKQVSSLPWAIESKNLLYVAEIPLDYIDENDAYLVFADLYYRLLAPEIEPVQQAAVRIEDVNPESDPKELREIADLLHAKEVPFQVAVIPVMIDQASGRENWYGLSIEDTPDIINALKYMQDRGGTLVQHGTTHQYNTADNPYSGRSGEDYEFFGYGCSQTEQPPYEWQTCQQDSWVRKTGPLPDDTVSDHKQRLEFGRDIMVDAGLGQPEVFVTPHYTASPTAYAAMTQIYDARYEQMEYYAGMLSEGPYDPNQAFAQFFPYTVHDIYGSTVFPENLQNITETEQNNHDIRTPQTLIDQAEHNLVVTESTASFYFHPFLDLADLEEVVEGIKALEYTFKPVSELQ